MSAPFEKYVAVKEAKPRKPRRLVQVTEERTVSDQCPAPLAETPFDRFQAKRKAIENRIQRQTYKEQLFDRIAGRLDTIHAYLQDDEVWFEKLERATFRDIAIFEGVYTDKLRELMGHTNQVVTVQHQAKLDQLLPALMQILQQRGLTVTATERKVEVSST